MQRLSSFFKSLLRKGITKTFFRIYAPKPKISHRFNQKGNHEEKCDELDIRINDQRSAHTVVPDLKINKRGSIYIPSATHSLKSYGNWTFDVAEIPILDPEKIFSFKHLFKNEPIVLYIHGYGETANHGSARRVLDAYLRRGDHSIMLFDWSAVANMDFYVVTMYKLHFLAQITAKAIDQIFSKTANIFNLDRVHLVAHSMGCHLGSLIAKNITTAKLKRITALDPVGIVYSKLKPESRLSKHDAEFVDVIHTDHGRIGYTESCGHADFYPNGGKRFQPGCPAYYSLQVMHPIVIESHLRSWQFYAESVTSDPSAFISCKAANWQAFKDGCVDTSRTAAMGYYATDTASGDYYLQTDSFSPYARGKVGLKYYLV